MTETWRLRQLTADCPHGRHVVRQGDLLVRVCVSSPGPFLLCVACDAEVPWPLPLPVVSGSVSREACFPMVQP